MHFELLKRCHFYVAEVATIKLHGLNFPLQGFEHRLREIDFFELLRAAEAAWTKHVDLHQLVAHDVKSDQEHTVFHQPRSRRSRCFSFR